MSLRKDIEASRDRTLSNLDDAHNYFVFTKRAWGTLRFAVQRGGLKFSYRNLATDSTVSENDFVALAQRYVAQELASATLQQFVAIFEDFQHVVLRQWLLAYPQSLSSRQLKGEDIFRLPDKTAIIDALIEKELNDVFYARPANWFEYLCKLTKIKLSVADVEQFAEIKATRDVLVHGQGVANSYYIEKAGKAARVRDGQTLDIPEPYHQVSWELIRKLVNEIGTAMAAKSN